MLEQIAPFLVAKCQRVNRINRWSQMGIGGKKKTCRTIKITTILQYSLINLHIDD